MSLESIITQIDVGILLKITKSWFIFYKNIRLSIFLLLISERVQ